MFGTNAITKNHLVGAAVGVGVAAVAFYLYKKNQAKVVEGLTEMKEHIEDLIAEKSAAESVEEVIVEAE